MLVDTPCAPRGSDAAGCARFSAGNSSCVKGAPRESIPIIPMFIEELERPAAACVAYGENRLLFAPLELTCAPCDPSAGKSFKSRFAELEAPEAKPGWLPAMPPAFAKPIEGPALLEEGRLRELRHLP